jgi:hypothetical protein
MYMRYQSELKDILVASFLMIISLFLMVNNGLNVLESLSVW